MDWDVVEARVLEPGCFWVKFADGLEGTVRFAPSAYKGVFAKLRDPQVLRISKVASASRRVTSPGRTFPPP